MDLIWNKVTRIPYFYHFVHFLSLLTLFGNVRAWRRTTQDDRGADDRGQKKNAKKRSIADQRDLFPIKFHSLATILLREPFLVSLYSRVHPP